VGKGDFGESATLAWVQKRKNGIRSAGLSFFLAKI
jgi:hypothetical protein